MKLTLRHWRAAALAVLALCAGAAAQVRTGPTPAPSGGGSGTVTSVAVSGGSTGLTTSGGPVTTSGTITFSGTLNLANGGTGAADAAGARSNLGLGTAAVLNAPASGNAASGELVKGDDTRLTNARTPTGGAGGVLSGSYPSPGFAVDMAEQGELDAHASNTSNPHSVTKAQVGLSNVTNDAQLKAASNLSDLANAAMARTNLGLGSAATSSSSDFAAASHAHAGAEITSGTVPAARVVTGAVTNERCLRINSSAQIVAHSADCGAGGADTLSFTAPTLSGSWVNWGGAHTTAGYVKSGGIVVVKALIKGGGAASTVFTLPTGFRPAATLLIPVQMNAGFAYISVDSSGNVIAPDGYSNSTWSLSLNFTFGAEQ